MEVEETIEEYGWRKGECGVVVMYGSPIVFPKDACFFIEVQNAIPAECSITFDGEPFRDVDSCCQFNTHSIALLDVCGQLLADVALHSCLNELVVVIHAIQICSCMPVRSRIGVPCFRVEHTFGFGCRIVSVVSKVVALWFAIGDGMRDISPVPALMPTESCFGVQEVVVLVYVEVVLAVGAVILHDELVVISVGTIAYMTVLEVAPSGPAFADAVGGFGEDTMVVLRGIGIVVGVLSAFQHFLAYEAFLYISNVAEVIACEALESQPANHIPSPFLVVGVPKQAVGVLFQSFLPHHIALHLLSVCPEVVEPKLLRQLVVGTELFVVAVAVGVVKRSGGAPVLVDVPSHREDVVVLLEVVCRARPERAVAHGIAFCEVVAVVVTGEVAILVVSQSLVERVEFA